VCRTPSSTESTSSLESVTSFQKPVKTRGPGDGGHHDQPQIDGRQNQVVQALSDIWLTSGPIKATISSLFTACAMALRIRMSSSGFSARLSPIQNPGSLDKLKNTVYPQPDSANRPHRLL
jgi:hypothetical protein